MNLDHIRSFQGVHVCIFNMHMDGRAYSEDDDNMATGAKVQHVSGSNHGLRKSRVCVCGGGLDILCIVDIWSLSFRVCIEAEFTRKKDIEPHGPTDKPYM